MNKIVIVDVGGNKLLKILITGTSAGMGLEIAKTFINRGHIVHGIDILPQSNNIITDPCYTHHIANIADADDLPIIEDIEILINNAGLHRSGMDIDVNLKGTMNVTEKYALNNPKIRAVVNQSSASAHMGIESGELVASKGGVAAYTKWVAKEIAKHQATCNSLSFGGVITEGNNLVMENPELWEKIMSMTPLKRWTTEEEAAEWVYFLAVSNRSCSGQDILIDNLESLNGEFIWT